jgi:hypothetical protein
MAVEDVTRPRHRQVRRLGLGLGVAVGAVGLAADVIGLSRSPGLGLFQLLLMAAGAVLVAVSLLGRRALDAYRGAALIGLNTLVLLVAVEGAAMVALWLMPEPEAEPEAGPVAYYAAQPWSRPFRREYQRAHTKKFHAYVMWRTAPFRGEYINVDADGIRRTEGSRCVEGAYRVFAFGGSTMWGVGSPDWGTIPSYLTAALGERLGGPICMVNFGEHGWVSTQSLVQLIGELDAGNVPHLVLFYDGINDSYSAVRNGVAGEHLEIGRLRSRLEEREPAALSWLRQRGVYRIAARVRGAPPGAPEPALSDELAQAVVDTWLSNYRIVAALGREYGFDYRFFWQPNLIVCGRTLTPEEERLRHDLAPQEADFIARVYARMGAAARQGHANLHDIADLFDEGSGHPYVDWMHLTPDGNREVANAIAASIGE